MVLAMSRFFDQLDLEHFAEAYVIPLGINLIIAVLIFYLGRTIARALIRALDRMMERSKLDISLRKFLHDMTYSVMLVAVVIAALDAVGVRTTAVIAVLGAAGLAIGLALQGSLSNFAAGVMLIILRPYKVNDLVVIGKYLGRVEAIKVFHTILITGDNREITIPNGQIIAGPIENLTVLGRRRIDLVVTVTEGELFRVKQLLEQVARDDNRVETSPAPAIDVSEISEAAVKLAFRPWTSVETYSAVTAETMEKVKAALTAAGMKFSVTLQPTV
jgi:small conductance mechanosensitive channel